MNKSKTRKKIPLLSLEVTNLTATPNYKRLKNKNKLNRLWLRQISKIRIMVSRNKRALNKVIKPNKEQIIDKKQTLLQKVNRQLQEQLGIRKAYLLRHELDQLVTTLSVKI